MERRLYERKLYDGTHFKLRQEAFRNVLDSLNPDDRRLIDGLIEKVQERQVEQSSIGTGRPTKGFGETAALEFVGAVGMLLADGKF